MDRILANQTVNHIGKEVLLEGWVNTRRDHGKLVFIDLRDRSGLVQVVGGEQLKDLRAEDVVAIKGEVKKRPESMVNQKIVTGEVEIEAKEVKILAKSAELPFPIDTPGLEIDEEIRLKYRYLDLRRPRLQDNLRFRHKAIQFIHRFLDQRDFIDLATPILTKATPEGARDFIVPSRLQKSKFYALPQSPQQYKQLLMVAGFEKYYQIARCFRDEDLRADRQIEFTQLDIELSFPTQEEILNLTEDLYTQIVEQLTSKRIFQKPFPRLTHEEAMEKYGTDSPDMRKDKEDKDTLAFCFIVDFPLFEWSKTEKHWTPSHHPFTAPKEEDLPLLDTDPGKAHSWQHDLVCNGEEVGGGSIRITDPAVQTKIFEILGHSKEEVKKKFGHLLKAFGYGVPPHGGIALGLDRLLAILCGEESIREVIAFPVTSSGQTAVMDAPSELDESQLKELGIKTRS